jgi:hypothetical protein
MLVEPREGEEPNLDYFAACVLPLSKDKPEYLDAADKYRYICGQQCESIRKCECGEPLAKKKRLCPKCAKKRQLEAKRKCWAATR